MWELNCLHKAEPSTRALLPGTAWDDFTNACNGVSPTPQMASILPPLHFFLCPSAIECWTSSPVLVSGPNTEFIQKTQLLLVSLYFSVRSLPTIASCKTIHSASLALAKKIQEAIILLHHSHYPKCHLRFQNIVPNYACCATALMGHSFTWCSPTRASLFSA